VADPGFDTVLREVAVRGGGDAELCVTRTRDRRYEAREGRLDGIALADTVAFGLRVFRDGRMGFSYGFRGDDADLARMVEEALFCADASDPDPAYGLPDAAGQHERGDRREHAQADLGLAERGVRPHEEALAEGGQFQAPTQALALHRSHQRTARAQQHAILRYGRLEICATPVLPTR